MANGYVYVTNSDQGTLSVLSATTRSTDYSVAFTESGLPAGAAWSVTLAGTTNSSTTSTITFSEPNGTYSFTVGGVAGYTASPLSGTVTVNGVAVTQAITFSPSAVATYAVTFTESGLPTGTRWSVTLAGVSKTSTATTITFQEPNGTYAFSVGPVSGYTSTPSAGSLSVSGAPVSQALTFSTSGSGSASGFLGLSGNTGYYLLGGIAIVVVAGLGVGLALRARRR